MKRMTFDGNSLLDNLLANVQEKLSPYDKLKLPPFRFYHPLCTVNIPETQLDGLARITRVGDVSFDMNPTQPTLQFAFSWPVVITDADVLITYWGLPQKGHFNWVLTNITSFQKIKYDTIAQSPTLEDYSFTLKDTTFEITGLGDPGKFTGQVLTEFCRQQKDLVLEIGSMVFKGVLNAAMAEMKAALVSTGMGVGGGVGGVIPGVPVG